MLVTSYLPNKVVFIPGTIDEYYRLGLSKLFHQDTKGFSVIDMKSQCDGMAETPLI